MSRAHASFSNLAARWNLAGCIPDTSGAAKWKAEQEHPNEEETLAHGGDDEDNAGLVKVPWFL